MARPSILLLPGLDGSGLCFERVLAILSRYYACRVFSYPQHLSAYTDLCEWLCGELDTETDYVIVGHSFGGPLAILLAETLGAQAKGLVLCATFCQPPLPRPLLLAASLLYPLVIRYGWMARFLNFFICNGSDLPLARAFHRTLMETPAATVARRIRLLRDLDMRPEISSLPLPCLALKAAKDRLVWFSRFSHLFVNGALQTIDGPHGLMELRPEAVAHAISGFIKAKN